MRRTTLVALLTLGIAAATPTPAAADITAFLGFSPTPERRSVKGFAFGVNMLVLGFEFEYANTAENELDGAPSVRTGMINGLVSTPTSRAQLYLTAGGGFYRERFRDFAETGFGTNFGGGVKMGLAGPVNLRLDYRIFALRGDPLYRSPKRFYAGINLAF